MKKKLSYLVIGAGHGAWRLGLRTGEHVMLFNRTWDHISVIAKRGGIELKPTEGT